MFASFWNREISAEAILDLDIFNLSSDKSKKSSGSMSTSRRADSDEEDDGEGDGNALFWQPGKRGYYAPRVGKYTPERINAYRNVGR